MRGPSCLGCFFQTLALKFASEPPRIVTLDNATASVAENPGEKWGIFQTVLHK
jgi:hypothetical protein